MPRSSFSLTTFPDAKDLQLSFLLLAVGAGFIFANLFVPASFGQNAALQKTLNKVSDHEIQYSLLAGQFRPTEFKGDTQTSLELTFYGISVLTSQISTSNGVTLKNEAKAKAFVQYTELKDITKNLENMYQGIVLLKRLGLWNAKKADRYYTEVLGFAETGSGFKLDTLHGVSVTATYYAFKAIEELGKTSEFSTTEQYASAVKFVAGQKDTLLNGFIDTTAVNETSLTATFYAVNLLPLENLTGVEQYVYACQSQDGGFSDTPIDSLMRYYTTESDVSSTIQAIYILNKLGVASSPVFDFVGSHYGNALAFLRHRLPKVDLKAAHLLVRLLTDFPSFTLGAPKLVTNTLMSIALIAIVGAIFTFYKPQVPFQEDGLGVISNHFKVVLGFLVVGYVVQESLPQFTILAYLGFLFFLALQYYEAQRIDTTDGTMILIASISSLLYMGLVISFVYISPFVYGQLSTFVVLILWSILSSFLSTYGSCYFVGKAQMRVAFFSRAGFLAWVQNVLLVFMFLHGRADILLFFRIVAIKGLAPVILVAFPFTTLLLNSLFSSVGYLVYSGK